MIPKVFHDIFEAINLELLKSEFQQYFLMRDFESGLCVLWDDGRVSAFSWEVAACSN
jgi:hypothetical protein